MTGMAKKARFQQAHKISRNRKQGVLTKYAALLFNLWLCLYQAAKMI
jgi:hypothetical protein